MGAVISAMCHRLLRYLCLRRQPVSVAFSPTVKASRFNADPFDSVEGGAEILRNVMEALDDSNTHLIGVYGSNARITDALLERVHRRAKRDELFGVVVKATVKRKPDVGKIQEHIAGQLKFTFNQKSKAKRANELIHRIRNEHKILIVFHDLHKKLDLSKVGIPYAADHTGCKIILTSTTEDVLSNHMHTQKNFKI